jgi:post-segregation antitoxin (ccd killing protein)
MPRMLELRDLNVQVPHELLKRAKIAAVNRDVTLRELVSAALESYLKEKKA